MNNKQFCYWLQGYFELRRDTDVALSTYQLQCISRHIDVCEAYMARREGLGPAVLAIRALIKAAPDNCTLPITHVLHDVFEHVIDPEAGAQSAKLSELHLPNAPHELTRC